MKSKYLEDAAQVIDGRVAKLEKELERDFGRQRDVTNASDRAAILEAQHCARLIRTLKRKAYRNPYEEAHRRWSRGESSQ